MPLTVEYIRSNGINNLKGCKISEVKPSKTRTHPVFERVNWLDIPTNMTHKDTSRLQIRVFLKLMFLFTVPVST